MFRSGRPFFFPFAAVSGLVLGLAITLAGFVGVRYLERQKMQSDFSQSANNHLRAVKQGFEGVVYKLRTVAQLFAVVDSVSRTQFHDFAAPLLTRSSYIQALSFQRLISPSQRVAYEVEMRKQFPDFFIREMTGTDAEPGLASISSASAAFNSGNTPYRVVDYIEPMSGNEAAFGLNMANNPAQIEAIERARDTGLPSATNVYSLAQPRAYKWGLAILMPIYQRAAILNSVVDRRLAVTGYASVVLRVEEVVGKMLAKEDNDGSEGKVVLNVYASATPDPSRLVYRSVNQDGAAISGKSGSMLSAWLFQDQSASIAHRFDIAGKPWYMIAITPQVNVVRDHLGSLLVLIAGSLLSLFGASYMYVVTRRSLRIQRLIAVRMQQVQRANELMKEDNVARKRAELALQLCERAIEASAHAIIIISATLPDQPVEYVNPAFERITGYVGDEVIGRNISMLHRTDSDQAGIQEIRSALKEHRSANAIFRSYHKDGTLFWNDMYVAPVKDDADNVSHFVVALYDITEMKRYEAELEHQAQYDPLTGLVNRNVLSDRLSQAIAYGARYNYQVWVLFVDLDRFKFVNDTLGHNAGDKVLKKVATLLKTFTREGDTIARLGSDEFVLILPEGDDGAHGLSVKLIQRMMEAIERPLEIEGKNFFLTCSVGVAVYPNDGQEAEILLKHADIAMYRAKELGNNNYQFYTAKMNERALERLRIEGDLRSALDRNEFILHYQPQIDLRTGQIIGMEALIRWVHPTLGLVSPARFIDLAEETGLIVQIGAWVLRTACEYTKALQSQGLGYLRISVNLSVRQFYQHNLVESVAKMLDETGLAPRYLELELTESLVMTDVQLAVSILQHLKLVGVKLSIDDFGTGYSSLAYLKRFPIDALKIDQSFVRDITRDQDDAAIVASIISLAHNLRLQVIAEGVETREQLSYLQLHHCDEVQGYYFSPGITGEAFETMLREGKSLSSIA
ncbi:EAL domain-containing protein [Glaciimonas sp. PCH181]|uniref:bifunctional diguanylate cyclase/phosphodiesterase n=1 Tax=Glaciimonas sp. PCH181 TaxID=2133943 RepID=UPI000D355E0E|nr:EAL domain-containing protein [Glaciimonas sp. PCH181]PUA20172.1 PAS domain S-box protein [Glaciimonas sp. PCH181]